ncbi:hypothetical protein [Actinomadura madurae]|uniref:hypothetical protein n=1 Tax=Actinomadura madurae TaxID=1993 RepID=UPI0035575008
MIAHVVSSATASTATSRSWTSSTSDTTTVSATTRPGLGPRRTARTAKNEAHNASPPSTRSCHRREIPSPSSIAAAAIAASTPPHRNMIMNISTVRVNA